MKIVRLLAALLIFLPVAAGAAELRLGLLAHDVPFLGHQKEDGADVNVEVLLDSPHWLAPILAPRPHLGVAINSVGDTSQTYAGLTWSWEPHQSWFVEFSFGGAIHNGKLDDAPPDRKELGSRVLFRESLALGLRLDERNSVSLYFDHESNARLADNNEGLNNLGIRWGFRF